MWVTVTAVVGNLVSALVCGVVAFLGLFSPMLPASCSLETAAQCSRIVDWMLALTTIGAPTVWLVCTIATWATRSRWRMAWAWVPTVAALGLFAVAGELEQYAQSLG